MDLGKKIKQMRTMLSLTQEELANRCELTKSYISQLENNKTSPSLATLTQILEVLGTNLADFFNEEHTPKIVFSPPSLNIFQPQTLTNKKEQGSIPTLLY
jgi:transcriptional regulator with XRE-family HTH domain